MDFGSITDPNFASNSTLTNFNFTFSEIPIVFVSVESPDDQTLFITTTLMTNQSNFKLLITRKTRTTTTPLVNFVKINWVAFGRVYNPNRKLVKVNNQFPIYCAQEGIILDFGLTPTSSTSSTLSPVPLTQTFNFRGSSTTPLVFLTPNCSITQIANSCNVRNTDFQISVIENTSTTTVPSNCNVFWMAILRTTNPLNNEFKTNSSGNLINPIGTTKVNCLVSLSSQNRTDRSQSIARNAFSENSFVSKIKGYILMADCNLNVPLSYTYQDASTGMFQLDTTISHPCTARALSVFYD